MNSRFRPKRSPRAAPVKSNTANVSVYALTVHSSCSSVAPRSTRITGMAVETTRLSSTTMKSAIDVTTNVQTVRDLAVMILASCVVSDYSALREKKEDYAASSERSRPADGRPTARARAPRGGPWRRRR